MIFGYILILINQKVHKWANIGIIKTLNYILK